MNPSEEFDVSSDGLLLNPGTLYLFNTSEILGSRKYVPIIKGRSSLGRLGLFINVTADLIDVGSINQWTLQLHAVIPLRVYPDMLIGQVTFWMIDGPITPYAGKYSAVRSPAASLSYLDFQSDEGAPD